MGRGAGNFPSSLHTEPDRVLLLLGSRFPIHSQPIHSSLGDFEGRARGVYADLVCHMGTPRARINKLRGYASDFRAFSRLADSSPALCAGSRRHDGRFPPHEGCEIHMHSVYMEFSELANSIGPTEVT